MYINIHTHNKDNSKKHLIIYNKDINGKIIDNLYFSSGIHPWFINENKISESLSLIKHDLSEKNCLALGECGLDKNVKTGLDTQILIFKKQLEINKNYNKPVIVHGVKSFQEIIKIKKEYPFNFIFHGFNKKEQVAQMLLKNGFYISFGKALLDKESLQKVFVNIPLNRIFFETDDANVSIENIYKKASALKKIPLESLILEIKKNFEHIFK